MFSRMKGAVAKGALLLTAATISVISGQDFLELSSYQELTDFAVNSDGLIAAVMDFSLCETNFDPADADIFTMDEFRKWIYFKDNGQTDVFRTTKWFLDANGFWSYLKIEAMADDTATMWIQTLSNTTADLLQTLVISNCPIGSGVKLYAKNAGMEYDKLDAYEDVKAALLEGRSLRTKPNITACAGVDWEGNGVDILFGSTLVDDWEIINAGSSESEEIHISYNFWVDYFVSAYVGAESIDVWIRQDGSVQMSPAIIDFLTWTNNAPNPLGYQCQLGTSFQIVAPAIASPLPLLLTYQEVLQALRSGHEVEVTIDVELCQLDQVPPGLEISSNVFSHRAYFWDIHTGSLGEGEYAQVYELVLDDRAHMIQGQYAITEEENVQVLFKDIDPLGEITTFAATCPLGSGSVVRSGTHVKSPLASFAALEEAVLKGRRVIFEADLDTCDSSFGPTGTIIGGSMADSNIQTFEGVRYVSALVADLAYDPSSEAFIWGAITVSVGSSGLAAVTIRGFQPDAGFEDVYEGAGVWICALNEGLLFLA